MKKLVLVLLISLPLMAQQKQPVSSMQEDCGVIFSFTTASSGAQASGTVTAGSTGTTAVIDNTQTGCLDWLVTYSTQSTVSALSLHLQTADNNAGVPGTWADYPGTLTTGINPNTAISPWATTEATGSAFPFVRMNLTSKTGAGSVTGKLYGWKRRPTYVTVTAGGGCPGTVGTPCVVDGPDAVGTSPTKPPVLVSGVDIEGNLIHVIVTDTAGNIDPAGITGAMSDGLSNTQTLPSASGAPSAFRTFPLQFNGSTWDRQFICPNRVMVTLTDATLTALVTVSGTTKVYVCQAHATTSGTAETFNLVQGTGVACAGAPATIDSYVGVSGFTTDYAPTAALRTTASNGLCVSQSGAAQTAVVWIAYAQF